LCGKSVEDKHHTDVNINKSQKHICFDCAQAVARAMMR
jgi:ribosome-binding protein aMBF1 (putative translation factor)